MEQKRAEHRQSEIEIRRCRNEDFEGIVSLLSQLWPNLNLDANRLRRVFDIGLASDRQVYLCATAKPELIGFGSLTFKNNLWQQGFLANVDELVVDAKHRGKGIGSKLLEHLVIVAQQKGCRRIELDSAFHREAAHRFYEREGFEKRAYLFTKAL